MRRAKEPSTYAGLAGVLQGLKMVFPQYAAYLDAGTIVAGSIAAVVADPGHPPKAKKQPPYKGL